MSLWYVNAVAAFLIKDDGMKIATVFEFLLLFLGETALGAGFPGYPGLLGVAAQPCALLWEIRLHFHLWSSS